MPPRPRRPRPAGGLADDFRQALRFGVPPLHPAPPADAVLRRAWREHGDRLIAEFPESPCDGFWRFDDRAPAELRTPAGEPALYDADDIAERERRRQRDEDRRRWWREHVKTTPRETA